MDNENTMVSMAEVDENMAIIQQKMSLMIDTHQNEIDKLRKQLIVEQEQVNFWKSKAEKKTEILMKYLPDYNPLFNPGSDTECIEHSLKKIIDENERLAKSVKLDIASLEELKMLRKENATLKEGEIAHLGKIDLLKHQLAGGVLHTPLVVQDINGKDVKIPNEEECQQMFGVSQEEYIMLVKNSDCQY